MFNLLPSHQKKLLHREYTTRVIVVALAMGSISSLVLFLSLLPAYSLSRSKANFSKEQVAEMKKSLSGEKIENRASFDTIQKLNAAVKQAMVNSPVNEIVTLILKYKTSDITISGFDLSGVQATGRSVTISGVAPTRESLLAFRKSLEKEKTFKNINVPDSNFQKNKDIVFTVSFSVIQGSSTSQ